MELREKLAGLGALILVVVMFLVIAGGAALMVRYQFEIYQKKHGQDMTFWEFFLDSERVH